MYNVQCMWLQIPLESGKLDRYIRWPMGALMTIELKVQCFMLCHTGVGLLSHAVSNGCQTGTTCCVLQVSDCCVTAATCCVGLLSGLCQSGKC